VAGDRAARQGSVAVEGTVYVAQSVTSGRGTVDTLELHGCRGGHGGLVLLDGAARLQHPHLISIRDRTSGRTAMRKGECVRIACERVDVTEQLSL